MSWRRLLGTTAPVLVTAAATVALGARQLTWPANTLDEMILLVYPLRMMHGDLPYRDFFAAYGPTHWWVLDGYLGVTGASVRALRLLGIVQHVTLTMALFRLALPAGRRWATITGCLGALLLFRLDDAPYAWVSAVALCLWQLVLLRRAPLLGSGAATAGALAGLAVGFRPDAVLLAVLPAIALLRATGHVRLWTLGLVAGLLPVWITLLVTPRPFLQDVFRDRAGRGAGQSRLGLWPAYSGDRQLMVVLGLTVVLTLVWALRDCRPESTALALAAVAVLPQALQRADANHFAYAGLVSMPFLPLLLCRLTNSLRSRIPSVTAVATVLGVSLFLAGTADTVQRLIITIRSGGDIPAMALVQHDGRAVPETLERAAALRRLLPYLDRITKPSQRLFVFDADLVRSEVNDVGVYFLMPNLRQRAHLMEVTPGVTNQAASGLRDDLEGSDVVVLVTAGQAFRQAMFPYEKSGSRESQDLLDAQFCLQAVIEYYQVYVRCAPGQ